MITRAQALSLLEPKISNIWNEAYPQRPVEYTAFVNIRETKKRTAPQGRRRSDPVR
jgi:hypothetical protein